MKVLLSMPLNVRTNKEDNPPLGLAYLAAVLINEGHSVKIIDPDVEEYNEKRFIKKVKQINPDVVGITCTSDFRFNTFNTANLIKKEFPDKKVILGGPHIQHTDVDTLEHIKSVDLIIRGEGEITLSETVNAIEKDKELDGIQGLTFRKEGKIKRNPDRPLIADIDKIPLPAREALAFEKYQGLLEITYNKKMTPVMGSRGCPMQCIFCSGTFGKTCRNRSPESVVEEIRLLKDKYKYDAFNIWDDIFTVNKKRTTEICNRIINEKLDISFFCNGHVNCIDKELIILLKKAGCTTIDYGIESGSQRILNVIKKGISVDKAKQAIEITLDEGVNVMPGIMFNHPTETFEDLRMTLEFRKYLMRLSEKYKHKAQVFHLSGGMMTSIYPGTEIEKIAKENGVMPKDFSWTLPYYNKTNLLWGENPNMPLYTGIPIPDFIKFYVDYSIKNKECYNLTTVIYKQLKALKKNPSIKLSADIAGYMGKCTTHFSYQEYKAAAKEISVLLKRKIHSITH